MIDKPKALGFSKGVANNVASITRPDKWPEAAQTFINDRTFDDECIAAHGITYLGKDASKKRTGYERAGLLFPYLDFKTSQATDKGILKPLPIGNIPYLNPKGDSDVYFASPYKLGLSHPEVAADTSVIVIIPESPVKAARMAQECDPKKLRAVAIAGNGCAGLGGKRKGFKKSLKKYKWTNRPVWLVPDSDWYSNADVRRATKENAKYLLSLGAAVSILLLPLLAGHDKTGPDDFLSHPKGGIDRLLALPRHLATDPIFDAWEVRPEVAELNKMHAIVALSSDVKILMEPDKENPQARFFTAKAFNLFYADKFVETGTSKKGVPILEQLSVYWIRNEHARRYRSVTFDPTETAAPHVYNFFRGFPYKPIAGDWSLFQEMMLNVTVSGDAEHYAWLINWMASRVQFPGEPSETIPVLQNPDEGIGKGFFVEGFGALFGEHFITVSSSDEITGRFNRRMQYGMLVFADEAFFAGDNKSGDILKSIVTAKKRRVEPKGLDSFEIDNVLGFIMASNHEHVIKAGMNARRFAVFDVSAEHKEDHEYFGAIKQQLDSGGYSAMMYDLLNHDVDKLAARKAPRTQALSRQKAKSMTYPEQFLFECLRDGAIRNWSLTTPENIKQSKASGNTEEIIIAERINVVQWSETHKMRVMRSQTQEDYRSFLDRLRAPAREYENIPTKIGAALHRVFGNIKSERYIDPKTKQQKWWDVLPPLAESRAFFANLTETSWNWRTGEPKKKQ